jgi:hypothetical protein
MKLLLLAMTFTLSAIGGSKSCKVNIEFERIYGSRTNGIERLIKRELKKKGYTFSRKGFSNPDFSLELSQGSVCTQVEEGVSIFEEVIPQVVSGQLINLNTAEISYLEGWSEGRIFADISGRSLRDAVKESLESVPTCK